MCSSNLTPAQKTAIEIWEKNSAKRIFVGTSVGMLAESFAAANVLRATDPAKAQTVEQALFEICGTKTPKADS